VVYVYCDDESDIRQWCISDALSDYYTNILDSSFSKFYHKLCDLKSETNE